MDTDAERVPSVGPVPPPDSVDETPAPNTPTPQGGGGTDATAAAAASGSEDGILIDFGTSDDGGAGGAQRGGHGATSTLLEGLSFDPVVLPPTAPAHNNNNNNTNNNNNDETMATTTPSPSATHDNDRGDRPDGETQTQPPQIAWILSQGKLQSITELSLSNMLRRPSSGEGGAGGGSGSEGEGQAAETEEDGAVPPELCDIASLVSLNLARNALTTLPVQFGALTQLTTLDLMHNKLASLPPSFAQLNRLTTLDLSHNRFASIPGEITTFTQLSVLHMSHNVITRLPLHMMLFSIVSFDLSFNQLAELPSLTGQIPKVEFLNISHNRLTVLPYESLLFLPNLRVLHLMGNPLIKPVPSHPSFAISRPAFQTYLTIAHQDATKLNVEEVRATFERQFDNIDADVVASVMESCGGDYIGAIDFLLSMKSNSTHASPSSNNSSVLSSTSSSLPPSSNSTSTAAVTGSAASLASYATSSASKAAQSLTGFGKMLASRLLTESEAQEGAATTGTPSATSTTEPQESLQAAGETTASSHHNHGSTRQSSVNSGVVVTESSNKNNFVRYENENNRMFKTLVTDPSCGDILAALVEKGMTLLVPQDIVLEGYTIDRNLLLTHTIMWNDSETPPTPGRPRAFLTLNGASGVLSTADCSVTLEPPIHEPGDRFEAAVLRHGDFQALSTGTGTRSSSATVSIPVYLISTPLCNITPPQPPASIVPPTTPHAPSTAHTTSTTPATTTATADTTSHTTPTVIPSISQTPPNTPSTTTFSSPSSSAQDRDNFGLQLARPLILDAFLTKLHHKTARHIRANIENFVRGIQKKGHVLEDQRDPIFKFFETTKQQLAGSPLWKLAPRAEMTYAEEALEAVVYTKIYRSVFYTASDQERDMMLSSKMKKLQFVTPDMLGIPPRFCNRRLWAIAEKELLMLNAVCSPKEKLRAIINCCKVIVQLLNGAENVAGADDFLPHLCIVVLRAYPPHLHSNVRFISRYVGANVLVSETLYYYTQVVSIISFIENLEAHHLNISQQQFERYLAGEPVIPLKSGLQPPPPPPSVNKDAASTPKAANPIHSFLVPATNSAPRPAAIRPSPQIQELLASKEHQRLLECESVGNLRVSDLEVLFKAYKTLAQQAQQQVQATESSTITTAVSSSETTPVRESYATRRRRTSSKEKSPSAQSTATSSAGDQSAGAAGEPSNSNNHNNASTPLQVGTPPTQTTPH
eukprot:TRINITY_DN1247_c0_g1_i8.p1 TRINITY_DN1247_c0_g1~~TRINITY_DN1247_c0_g1_i8.p1  ORF type:complete len:1214 (-),score=235.85 TRINITY_DN1247_c0_g1_i8:27-3668(-)